MTYYLFYLFLILAIFSIIASVLAIWRRDFNSLGVLVILFGMSLISLFIYFGDWVRLFSAIYGITWAG